LAARGHVVHGFDLNRHQVAFAKNRLKAKGLKGRVWRDRLQDFKVPKVPVTTSPTASSARSSMSTPKPGR
jgi:hypothetical protein